MASKSELQKLHPYHISLLGLNYISQYSLRHLLLHYIVRHTPEEKLDGATGKSAVSKFLKHFKDTDLKNFEKLHVFTYPNLCDTLFTDKSKREINDEVDYKTFDVTALGDIFRKCHFFPSCKYQLRRHLHCKGDSHVGKCCEECHKNHLCDKCRNNACKDECCLTGQKVCDHPCKCGVSKSLCSEKSTVCCKNCGTCFYCKDCFTDLCEDGRLRAPIEAMGFLKNLVSHGGDHTWIQLEGDDFESVSFPHCKNWKDLCNEIKTQLTILLSYLKNHQGIDDDVFQDKMYELRACLNRSKDDLIEKFQHELISTYVRRSMDTGLKIDLEIAVRADFPEDDLELYGGLMDHVCKGMKKTLKDLTMDEQAFDVKRRSSKIDRSKNLQFLKAEIKVNAQTNDAESLVNRYADTESDETRNFSATLKRDIHGILQSSNIDTRVRFEGLSSGCILIHMDISKKDKNDWKSGEKELVIERIKFVIMKTLYSVSVDVNYNDRDSSLLYVNLVLDVHLVDQTYSHLLDKENLTTQAKQLAFQYVSGSSDHSRNRFAQWNARKEGEGFKVKEDGNYGFTNEEQRFKLREDEKYGFSWRDKLNQIKYGIGDSDVLREEIMQQQLHYQSIILQQQVQICQHISKDNERIAQSCGLQQSMISQLQIQLAQIYSIVYEPMVATLFADMVGKEDPERVPDKTDAGNPRANGINQEQSKKEGNQKDIKMQNLLQVEGSSVGYQHELFPISKLNNLQQHRMPQQMTFPDHMLKSLVYGQSSPYLKNYLPNEGSSVGYKQGQFSISKLNKLQQQLAQQQVTLSDQKNHQENEKTIEKRSNSLS